MTLKFKINPVRKHQETEDKKRAGNNGQSNNGYNVPNAGSGNVNVRRNDKDRFWKW